MEGAEDMGIAEEMRQRLEGAFAPTHLVIADESEAHRGHAGHREGGGTHWRVTIHAPAFAAMSRIERHRAVHAALGPGLIGQLHALALSIEG